MVMPLIQSRSPHTGPQRLILPGFPSTEIARTLSPNGRAHWGAKNTARAKVAVTIAAAALMHGLQPVRGPVRITFVWVFPRGGRHDLDNLIGSGVTKAAIDALVRADYLEDDDSRHVVGVTAEVRVERGRRALEIVLEPQEAERALLAPPADSVSHQSNVHKTHVTPATDQQQPGDAAPQGEE